jgi:hypothetical protein
LAVVGGARRAASARLAGGFLFTAFRAGCGLLQERRGMALTAFGVTQHRRDALGADQRLGLGLDHGQGVALGAILAGTLVAIASRPVFSGPIFSEPIISGPVIPRTVIARAVVTGSVFPGTVIGPGAVVARTFVTRPVISGAIVSRTVVPGAVVPGTVFAPAVAAAVAARSIVSGPVVSGPVVAGSLVPGPIIPRPVVSGAVVAGAFLPAAAAGLSPLVGGLALFGAVGLRLGAALVLEIYVEARGELVATEDLAGRTLRLDGAQQAEIVFGVLQVVLAEHPVAGGVRVAGQLLVFLEDVLGVAPHLDALGPVAVEGAIGVLLLRLATAATAAAPIAPALALHTLEISHNRTVFMALLPRADRRVAWP